MTKVSGGNTTLALIYVVPFVVLLAIWQSFDSLRLVSEGILPSPIATASAVYILAKSGTLGSNVIISLLRTAAALVISLPVGIFVGLLMGWNKLIYRLMALITFLFFSIPKLSLYTIVMFIFGFTNQSVVVISYLGSVFPVLFASIAASRSIDKSLIYAAKDNYANGYQIFTKVLIPNSLPTIGAGIKLSIGIGFVETITAELYQAPGGTGLGYLLVTAGTYGQADVALGVLITTIILGGAILVFSEYVERRLSSWRRKSV